MDKKTKEALLDMAHLIHQAIITDDERIAMQCIADVELTINKMKGENG